MCLCNSVQVQPTYWMVAVLNNIPLNDVVLGENGIPMNTTTLQTIRATIISESVIANVWFI